MLFVARITHTVTGITPYHESSDSMRPSMAAASTSHGYSPAMTLLPRDAWIVGGCDCRWLQNHEMKTSPSRHLAFHRCLGKTAHSGKWSSDASPLSRCDASDALLALFFMCRALRHCSVSSRSNSNIFQSPLIPLPLRLPSSDACCACYELPNCSARSAGITKPQPFTRTEVILFFCF
jgi:hypothetical protein